MAALPEMVCSKAEKGLRASGDRRNSRPRKRVPSSASTTLGAITFWSVSTPWCTGKCVSGLPALVASYSALQCTAGTVPGARGTAEGGDFQANSQGAILREAHTFALAVMHLL